MKYTLLCLLVAGTAGAASGEPIMLNVGNWTVDQTDISIMRGDKTVENSTLTECWPTEEYTTLNMADLVPEGCTAQEIAESATGYNAQLSCTINGGSFSGRVDARRYNGGDAVGWSLSLWSGISDGATEDVISSNYTIAKRVGDC